MQKRAQFFLIASFIIVGIIISLSTVYIAIHAMPEEKKVYDLSKEINEETAQIISHGVLDQVEIMKNINTLANTYSQSYPDSEIAIIYGSPNSGVSLAKYFPCDPMTVSLETSTTYTCSKISTIPDLVSPAPKDFETGHLTTGDGKIITTLKGEEYKFDIPQNQESYFYIIVRTPKLGQRTVATAGST